jgi:enamine deaminase RidA (YjgF/YER057c/UK114 family)
MKRQNISAKTPWEDVFGYSRAVRIGDVVKVGGTIATDEHGAVYGEGDIYAQADYIFQKIEKALQEAGASLSDVVRTRSYVTNLDEWEGLARAHLKYFDDIRPAATMIEISRLMAQEFLVEIEVEAIVVS